MLTNKAVCFFLSCLIFSGAYSSDETVFWDRDKPSEVSQGEYRAPQSPVMNITELTPTRCTNERWGFGLNAEFLYWRAAEEDLFLTYESREWVGFANNAFLFPILTGDIHGFDFDWEPAFRVGGKLMVPYDNWDVLFNWTWYRNVTNQTLTSLPHQQNPLTVTLVTGLTANYVPDNSSLQPNQNINTLMGNGGGGTHLFAKWKLQLNMAELDLGKEFYISKGLSLKPYLGVKGGWIDRELSVEVFFTQISGRFPNFYTATSNWWGLGPRLGLLGNFIFPRGFKISGNLSGSLLSGKVNKGVELVEQFNNTTFFGTSSNLTNEGFWRMLSNIQMMLGLGWGTCYYQDKFHVKFSVNWEVNQYFNLKMFTQSDQVKEVRNVNSTTLTLYGLTANAAFDF